MNGMHGGNNHQNSLNFQKKYYNSTQNLARNLARFLDKIMIDSLQ